VIAALSHFAYPTTKRTISKEPGGPSPEEYAQAKILCYEGERQRKISKTRLRPPIDTNKHDSLRRNAYVLQLPLLSITFLRAYAKGNVSEIHHNFQKFCQFLTILIFPGGRVMRANDCLSCCDRSIGVDANRDAG
jgi:hypothetical protein